MSELPRFLELTGAVTALDTRGRFYTVYQLRVLREGVSETVGRRYRSFQSLNDRIRGLPRAQRPDKKDLPHLTGKKFWVANLREDVVEKRRRKLPEYVREISALACMYPAIAAELQRFYDEEVDATGAGNGDDEDMEHDGDGDAEEQEHGPEARPSVAVPVAAPASAQTHTSPLTAVAALTALPSATTVSTSGTSASATSALTPASSQPGAPALPGGSPPAKHVGAASSPPARSAPSSPASKCLMCDRMIALTLTATAWDSSKFCSQQCAAFHAAATNKGFAITSVDGKRALGSAAPADSDATSAPDGMPVREKTGSFSGRTSWWGGRRGSTHGVADTGGPSRTLSMAAPPSAGPPADASSAASAQAAPSRRSLLSAMLGRTSIAPAPAPAPAAGDSRRDSESEMDPEEIARVAARAAALTGELAEAEVVKRNFEERRKSVRDNRSVLARFRTTQGRSTREVPAQPTLPQGQGLPPAASGDTSSSSVLRSAGRIFGFGGAETHTAPPPPPKVGASGTQAIRVELVHHRGMMWKRGATGLKTWKIRFFELKDWSLYYYRTSNHVLLGRMQLIAEPSQAQLLAVASELRGLGADVSSPEFSEVLFRVLEGAYFAEVHELTPAEVDLVSVPSALQRRGGRPFVFAVLTPDRDLVCGCTTEEEYNGWVRGIRRLVRNEQQRLLAIVRSAFPRLSSRQLLPPVSSGAEPAGGVAGAADQPGKIPTDASAPTDGASIAAEPSASVPAPASGFESGGPMTNSNAASSDSQSQSIPAAGPRPEPSMAALTAAARAMQTGGPSGLVRQRSLSVSEAAALVAAHAAGRLQSHGSAEPAASGSSAVLPHSVTASTASGADLPSAAASKIMGMSRQSSVGAGSHPPAAAVAAAAIAHTWEIAETDVEVVDRIGGGNFGEVYRGRLWGTDVAVKLLISAAVTPDILEDLKAEVAILSQLRHPNVVLYLGACTTPPNIFIVTEWCERGSLHSLLYDHTVPMSVANRLGLALQTAQGMCYLHAPRRKIIHRDLKSHNLLVTRDFTVKVADFGLTIMRTSNAPQRKFVNQQVPGVASSAAGPGIAPRAPRAPEPGKTAAAPGASSAEEEGNFYGIQGTPQWMAPEVLEGQRYNGSVDVYSFGVVLSELTSRALPFSDTYKRFDFIDAVLEEGAMPTIPRWCGDVAVADWDVDDEEAPAVSADGLPWGWRDDLVFIGALPPAPVGAVVPMLGSCVFREGRRNIVSTPPLPPRKTSQDSDNFSAPGDARSARQLGDATGIATPAAGSTTGGPGAPAKSTVPVLGGVSEWRIARGESTGVLRMMIESCLNRDPDLRPSFDDIVDLLRALIDRPVSELFQQLEVPRLREALCYGDDTDAAVAANEIVHFASYALFCNMTVLPDRGAVALAGQDNILYGAARQPVRFDPPEMDDSAPASSAHLRGLIIKFQPFSTGFQPLLAFAPPPSAVMSHMHSMPYVDLATVQHAAPELLAGIAARLRTIDCFMRARLGLPLYCPDLAVAATAGRDHGGYTLLRVADPSAAVRIAICVSGFSLDGILQDIAKTISPTSSRPGSGATSSAPTTPSNPPRDVVKRSTTMARAAARRAAAQEEDERKKRRMAMAAMAHLSHAIGVILTVMDAGSAAPTAMAIDTGGEIATSEAGYRRLLPPAGSTDRLLLSLAPRVIFPLASMVVAQAVSHVEYNFITRPTGGDSADWRHRYRCVTEFPPMPDFGADAPLFAATLLRQLWTRLPMLRTVMAHVVTVTAVAAACGLGTVQVLAQRIVDGDAAGAGEWFSVQVPEETVQARFFGVVLNRLASAIGVDPGNRTAFASLRSHALVAAVEHRIRATTVKRADGIIMGSLEIDEFDATLY